MDKIHFKQMVTKQNKGSLVISDKIDFKLKMVKRDKFIK